MRPEEEQDDVRPVVERALAVLRERPSALITDIDGTLSRIAERPEDATVSQRARDALERIRARVDLLAVITARPQDVARQMVGLDGIEYIGSYALRLASADEGPNLDEPRKLVPQILGRFPCARFEEKGISFALHYRGCDEPQRVRSEILEMIYAVTMAAGGKIVEGKRVLEVVPEALPDKGTAFSILTLEHSISGSIFMGDDLSDIAVFNEITERRERGLAGAAIGVVDAETESSILAAVDLTLQGVDAVEEFLEGLADGLENGGQL